MPGNADNRGARPVITAEEPEELAHWRAAGVYKTGPRSGQPKTRPPVIIVGATGLKVVKKDGEAVAYVANSFAEVVRAAIDAEVRRRAL